MKKTARIICIICLTLITPLVFSCSCKKDELSSAVSQIRSDIFKGSGEKYSVEIYSEEKEFPFINDRYVGEKKTCLVVKIKDCFEKNLTVTLSYDGKNYSSPLSYLNASNSLTATVLVPKFPVSTIDVTLSNENGNDSFTARSVKKSDAISPLTALKSVSKSEKDFVSSLYVDGVFGCEIYIRLLAEGDYNFYYVGFAQGDNKITAFLLDGQSGEIIAGKTT